MSLRFVDSFAHYVLAQIGRKYPQGTAGIASIGAGRYGAGSASVAVNFGSGNALDQFIGAQATVGQAFGVKNPSANWSAAPYILAQLLDGATPQVTLVVVAPGLLRVLRGGYGGAVIGTASLPAPASNAWFHVEWRVTISGAAGIVDVWLNGQNVLHLAGQNTQSTGNASATVARLAGDGTTGLQVVSLSDYILYDGQAGVTGPVGDCRVQALLPTGAGNYAQYTTLVGAATQWQAVNDNPADDDASYIGSATAGQISSFATANLTPTSGTVVGVAVNHQDRKDDAGARAVAGFARLGAVDKAAAGQALTNSYVILQDAMETDPNNAAWTIANVNAAEFGVKEIA